jgi:lipid A 3-O-deacylase
MAWCLYRNEKLRCPIYIERLEGSNLSLFKKISVLAAVVFLAANASISLSAQASQQPAVSPEKPRTWEFGPFVQGGSGVGERDDYQFFAIGFQAGRVLSPVVHAGLLTGEFEFGANILPFWQAYTPAPTTALVTTGGAPFEAQIGGGTFTGLSITPVIFRWNFRPKSHRVMPWAQAAGGVIYTSHKFPPSILVNEGQPGGTSVFNFSPQGGVGVHYFIRPRRSIDIGLNAEHISSASLGDRNPGVNASVQMQVGYTWWK